MKIYAPDYYNEFSCIADKCKHSCCIGWEIDIDDYTFELYNGIDGELGKKLSQNIVTNEDNVHSFKLCEGERCPFLNEKGLCELILEKGEDILCDICNDHPRFRNFYTDRTEMGLGLCCEAVSELICGREKKTVIIFLTDDGISEDAPDDYEEYLYETKETAIAIMQDRSISYSEREMKLLPDIKYHSNKEIYDILFPLERLSAQWDDMLSALLTESRAVLSDYDTLKEQLAVYFIFRHLNYNTYDVEKTLKFALFSVNAIMTIAKSRYGESPTSSEIADTARMYSAEIEYSDCNIDGIINNL